ncbi:MAG: 50S ribosomal protein L15 [Anaerolineae bacterium]|jgi:large subunit ribosomal protein L15
MKLHELGPDDGAKRPRKRKGRGIAAGQGKTAGYGTKGQNARAGRGGKLYFEGGQLPLVRRLAFKRGFRNPNRVEYAVVNVGELPARFEAGAVIDRAALEQAGLIRANDQPVKVLGDGELDRALTLRVDAASQSARAKIEAAGGALELLEVEPA